MTNQIHDAFDKLEASEKLEASTMQFLQAEREKRTSRQARRPRWSATFAAACAALVLLLGLGGYYTAQTPVSYVSIDVNPSVELALNRFDRVVSATAYNGDGEIILEGINVKGKLYTDAIDAIVESSAMQPYLTNDSALTFTVAANNSSKESTLLTGVKNCSGCRGHGGQSYTADVSSITTAHDNGLSFGKYAAYLVLSQYDSSITTEDCHNMSMAEIHNQIREHENGAGHNGSGSGGSDDSCNTGNGNHNENGNGAKHGQGDHHK